MISSMSYLKNLWFAKPALCNLLLVIAADCSPGNNHEAATNSAEQLKDTVINNNLTE